MFKLPLLPLPYNFKVLYFDCKDTPFIRVNQRKTEKSTFTHQDFGNQLGLKILKEINGEW